MVSICTDLKHWKLQWLPIFRKIDKISEREVVVSRPNIRVTKIPQVKKNENLKSNDGHGTKDYARPSLAVSTHLRRCCAAPPTSSPEKKVVNKPFNIPIRLFHHSWCSLLTFSLFNLNILESQFFNILESQF